MLFDQLRAMAVFAKTVETGSFRGAAKALGLSPSVVSHHVAQLEAELDVLLLSRSTRKIALTADGKKLFDSAKLMLRAAEDGLSAIAERSDNPSGRLTVAAPAALAHGKLIDDLAAFALAFPRVELTLRFSDSPIDLVGGAIDVAIRAGTLRDSNLKAKKLFELPRKLLASPAYLAAHAKPNAPQELVGWDWVRLESRPAKAAFLRAGRKVEIEFAARVVADNAAAMLELAQRGLGLCMVPEAIAEPELSRGKMVEVLKEWRLDAPNVYAVWPANAPRAGLSLRLVSFLESRS